MIDDESRKKVRDFFDGLVSGEKSEPKPKEKVEEPEMKEEPVEKNGGKNMNGEDEKKTGTNNITKQVNTRKDPIEENRIRQKQEFNEEEFKAACNKSLSRIDVEWIAPIAFLFLVAGSIWGLMGLGIFSAFLIIVIVMIVLMSSQQQWFMSTPQNSGVGIMWGTGKNANLHKFVVSLGKNNFAVDAEGKLLKSFYFEKKYNIWWMGLHGSVHRYHTTEVDQIREEIEVDGLELAGQRRKPVRVTKDFIEINREVVLPLIVPPLICADNYEVQIDVTAYYIIVTVHDAIKALFNVGNLSLALNTKFEIALKESTANLTFDELRKQKESIREAAWKKMKEVGDFDLILKNWGTLVTDIGISDINPEPTVAVKLRSVFMAQKDKEVREIGGVAEMNYRTSIGKGEKNYQRDINTGRAEGYKLIAAVPGGTDMFRAEQMKDTPGTKILSSEIFTGSSGGKNVRNLAAELVAGGYTLEQIREEVAKAKQPTEDQKKSEEKKPDNKKKGKGKGKDKKEELKKSEPEEEYE